MKKFIIAMIFMTASVYSQHYEIYTGAVISEDKDMHSNYMLGLNFTVKLNQDREYLNKMLFGMEHAAYMSNNKTYGTPSSLPESTINDCGCTEDPLGFGSGGNYTTKKMARTVSLNVGVELCEDCWFKRLYVISGITSSLHILKVNNEKLDEYYSTHVDFGLKYFVKLDKKNFITPTIKFNPETVSFGIGYSR